MKIEIKCSYCGERFPSQEACLNHETTCAHAHPENFTLRAELVPTDTQDPLIGWDVVMFTIGVTTCVSAVELIAPCEDEGDMLPRWQTQCKNTDEDKIAAVNRLREAARDWLVKCAQGLGKPTVYLKGRTDITLTKKVSEVAK